MAVGVLLLPGKKTEAANIDVMLASQVKEYVKIKKSRHSCRMFSVSMAKHWRKRTHPERKLRSAQPLHLWRREDQEPPGSGYLSLRSSTFSLFRKSPAAHSHMPQIDVQVTVPPQVCQVYGNAHRSLTAGLSALTGTTERLLGSWKRRGLRSGHAQAHGCTCSDSRKSSCWDKLNKSFLNFCYLHSYVFQFSKALPLIPAAKS